MRFVFELMLGVSLLMAACGSVIGQAVEVDLAEKPITLALERKSLGEVFFHLIYYFDVQIGYEGSKLDNDHMEFLFPTQFPDLSRKPTFTSRSYRCEKHCFTLNVKNAPLKSVLDQVVKQMENYKWEIEDGVVNIFPTEGRDERLERLMELKISSFNLESNRPVGLIRNKVGELPELQRFLAENKFVWTNNRAFGDSLLRRIEQKLEFSEITFKQLLNRITKIKKGGWIVRKGYLYKVKDKEYIEIDV